MEAVLVLLVPVVLLWMGLSLTRGRPLNPDAVLRSLSRSSWRTLKWLWRDRPERGGPGRLRRPPYRYRR
jgi:hypothetical protein